MKQVSPNTEAILLLTAPLLVGKQIDTVKPLAPREYRELALALVELGREPADLMQDQELLNEIAQGVVAKRVVQLLNRGLQLAQALDGWSQRGIRVLSRADSEYPALLKERLKGNAPSLLYCCGNLDLFNRGGLAVVGSRKVDENNDLVGYTDQVGAASASEGISIISGGARGADKISMLGSLKRGGFAVGVLSCKMKQDVVSKDYKPHLRENRLLLCSVADPSAGWNTGHAMQRNKYIYALADHALIIASETKGGTWEGATEQLKKFKCCPVLVNASVCPAAGNKKLLTLGAKPICLDFSKPVAKQFQEAAAVAALNEQADFFKNPPEQRQGLVPKADQEKPALRVAEKQPEESYSTASPAEKIEQALFPILLVQLAEPTEPAKLQEITGLKKGQLDVWLKKMQEQGLIKKKNKPVRYVALRHSAG